MYDWWCFELHKIFVCVMIRDPCGRSTLPQEVKMQQPSLKIGCSNGTIGPGPGPFQQMLLVTWAMRRTF
jgi:hypothetical protein